MKRIVFNKFNLKDFLGIDKIPVFLKDGFMLSIVVHIFILILIMVLPFIQTNPFKDEIKYDEPIIVDLENLVIAKKTVLPPAPSVVDEKDEAKPDTTSVKPDENKEIEEEVKEEIIEEEIKTPDTEIIEEELIVSESKPKKDLAKERIGGIEDLLASVDGLEKKKEKTTEIKKGIQAASLDLPVKAYQENSTDFEKQQMAISYIDAIRVKLRSCWNIDAGAKDIKDMKIVIKTSISSDGNVYATQILNEKDYIGSPSFKAVSESAKRALIICSPYDLPEEFYNDWKSIIFTFYPDKKSVK